MVDLIEKSKTNNLKPDNFASLKEIANILGVTERTVRDAADRKGVEGTFLPFETKGGIQKKRAFNEREATIIKQEIQKHHNLQSRKIDSVSTELEENELILKSMNILQERNEKLRKEVTRLGALVEEKDQVLIEQKPKIELLDKITGTDNLYSMKQVKELLQLPYGRNTLYAILRDKGCLNSNNEPYQRYSKYFVYKLIFNERLNKNIGYTLVTNEGLQYIDKLLKSND